MIKTNDLLRNKQTYDPSLIKNAYIVDSYIVDYFMSCNFFSVKIYS